jgi:hypothetical protein
MKKLLAATVIALSGFAANAQDVADLGRLTNPECPNNGVSIGRGFQNCLNIAGAVYLAGILGLGVHAYRQARKGPQ